MSEVDIENGLRFLINDIDHDEFPYKLLEIYGTTKATITRMKQGNKNLAKQDNQLILKKKLFYQKALPGENLLSLITALDSNEKTHVHDPRFIVVTNFDRLMAKDTKTKDTLDIGFKDLWKHPDFFLPWMGKEKYQAHTENPADVKAAEKMARIYDEIYHNNKEYADKYNHDLNVFLTRLLFCFFAEDTGIFKEENMFTKALSEHTHEDGSDLQHFFEVFFESLDKQDKSKYPQYIQKFPYVNGKLFRDPIKIPQMTAKVRKLMIECGDQNNWQEINPDIFGSMFQAVKTAEVRSGLGQHYTSVPNIMKVINPLFMDDLREEFEKNKDNVDKLKKLQLRLKKIRIFDPACGSGNFLIIAFKQMKLLEMDIIKRVQELTGQKDFQMELSIIELKQFYGIEIDDFACEIAKLSLYLAAHQMNCLFEDAFGHVQPTLPLQESGHIVCGNALRIDWEKVCPKYIKETTLTQLKQDGSVLHADFTREEAEVYILGNPPYIGTRNQDEEQKSDIAYVFRKYNDYKNLDYIACWFYLGRNYILGSNDKLAFVSTNSITQGEQVPLLWPKILDIKIEIAFAYNSFKWTNNAKHNAGVTCTIIGIQNTNSNKKVIYSEHRKFLVSHINGYLIDYDDIYIHRLNTSLSNLPKMSYGNYTGGCNALMLNENEALDIINNNGAAKKFIRPLSGSQEYINNIPRFCIWIQNEQLAEALLISDIKKRIDDVKKDRLATKDKCIQKLATRPHQFRDMREAKTFSIIVPVVSSERRKYIPIGFLTKDVIISNSAQAVYDAEPWIFGVLTSQMHMVWVRAVGGRLKTDYRYSAELCYNTFPFPKISEQQKKRIELCVNEILRARAKHSEQTMAELYDPDKMPEDLLKAHQSLDAVIEACYKKRPFDNDEQRLAHLFKMYEMMTHNASEEELKQLELGV